MATNEDRPFGFLPARHYAGGAEVGRVWIKAAADAVVLGIGDLVNRTSAVDTVARSAAGGPFLGASLNFGAASTLTNHFVPYADARTVFVAQEDSDGGAIAAASEGLNATIIVADANTTTGLAQSEIDSSTVATTSTLDVRLLEIAPYANNAQGTNARWFVYINDLSEFDLKAGI
jgi:hypothetical protein